MAVRRIWRMPWRASHLQDSTLHLGRVGARRRRLGREAHAVVPSHHRRRAAGPRRVLLLQAALEVVRCPCPRRCCYAPAPLETLTDDAFQFAAERQCRPCLPLPLSVKVPRWSQQEAAEVAGVTPATLPPLPGTVKRRYAFEASGVTPTLMSC